MKHIIFYFTKKLCMQKKKNKPRTYSMCIYESHLHLVHNFININYIFFILIYIISLRKINIKRILILNLIL